MADYTPYIPSANETGYPQKISDFITEVGDDVTVLQSVSTAEHLTSDNVVADTAIMVGDGVARKLKTTGILIDGSNNMSNVTTIDVSGSITGGSLNIGIATLTAAELDVLDGVSAGTAAVGKAVVLTTGNLIDTINITKDGLEIGGTSVTTTAAELNILDGVTGTSAGDLTAIENFEDTISSSTTQLTIKTGKIFKMGIVHNETYTVPLSALDFNKSFSQTISVTGSETFTTSNRESGITKRIELKITASGDCSFGFPPEWDWIGVKPSNILSGKVAILNLRCDGNLDDDILAVYAVQS